MTDAAWDTLKTVPQEGSMPGSYFIFWWRRTSYANMHFIARPFQRAKQTHCVVFCFYMRNDSIETKNARQRDELITESNH